MKLRNGPNITNDNTAPQTKVSFRYTLPLDCRNDVKWKRDYFNCSNVWFGIWNNRNVFR